jgi:hypothetical protein
MLALHTANWDLGKFTSINSKYRSLNLKSQCSGNLIFRYLIIDDASCRLKNSMRRSYTHESTCVPNKLSKVLPASSSSNPGPGIPLSSNQTKQKGQGHSAQRGN